MYERKLDGRVLSFGHAGILIRNSFVMYDRQTDSLWIHVTGEAYQGPLKGKKLTFLPSTVTTWRKWKEDHPTSLVLPGRRRGGFMGTFNGLSRTRNFGLSVVVRFKSKLYPYSELRETPVVNDRLNGAEVVVYYSRDHGTATAWRRKLDGRSLTFALSAKTDSRGNELMKDNQTGSLWNWLTGVAVAGPLKGRELAQLAYNPILSDRFRAFYPDRPIYGRDG